MKPIELIQLIEKGETTTFQIKERIDNAYSIGKELVAFANSKGGKLIVGVNDKTGRINGLSFQEIEEINNLLSNAADNNVRPSIYLETETVNTDDGKILVVSIRESLSKPVMDNKGIIWIKNGADKRKVTSPDELRRLFQSTKSMYADEMVIEGTSM